MHFAQLQVGGKELEASRSLLPSTPILLHWTFGQNQCQHAVHWYHVFWESTVSYQNFNMYCRSAYSFTVEDQVSSGIQV